MIFKMDFHSIYHLKFHQVKKMDNLWYKFPVPQKYLHFIYRRVFNLALRIRELEANAEFLDGMLESNKKRMLELVTYGVESNKSNTNKNRALRQM